MFVCRRYLAICQKSCVNCWITREPTRLAFNPSGISKFECWGLLSLFGLCYMTMLLDTLDQGQANCSQLAKSCLGPAFVWPSR